MAEEIAAALAAGQTVVAQEMAVQFGVEEAEVVKCLAALRGVQEALGEDFPAEPGDVPPPQLPPDYEVLGELGRGGMGVVYRVRQKSLDRLLALKMLRPGDLLFGDMIRRFKKEAQHLAKLRHRHIVPVHEVGESGGNVYFTMDLIEGSSLADLIARKRVTASQSVRLLRQVASAVAYTHSHGLIHRDLKPQNVLIDAAGDAYVVDFGLARNIGGAGSLTGTGHIMGTPAYMSPEQARGETASIGEATDVYALGAVLYECLTGRPPVMGRSLADVLHAVIHVDPLSARRLNPTVHVDLDAICLKAIEKDPSNRYTTVRAFLEDLDRFEEGRPIRARRADWRYILRRWSARHRRELTAGTGIAVAFLALVAFVIVPMARKDTRSIEAAAARMHEAGRHEAALALYEEVAERHGWKVRWDLRDPVRDELLERLTRCRVEVARGWAERGMTKEALDLLKSTLRMMEPRAEEGSFGLPWRGRFDLMWEIAMCQSALRMRPEAYRSMTRLVGDEGFLDHSWETGTQMLERLWPALADREDPMHESAVALAEFAIKYDINRRQFAEWFGAKERLAIPAVIDGLCLERGAGPNQGPRWVWEQVATRLAATSARKELEAALAEALEKRTLDRERRDALLNCLVDSADLPFEFQFIDGKYKFDREDEILPLWREISGMTRVEAYRRKVEHAIQYRIRTGWENKSASIGLWVSAHTGCLDSINTRTQIMSFDTWWREHGNEEPRAWLSKALGLEMVAGPEDVPTLLRAYLENQGWPRENLQVHLLEVLIPDEVPFHSNVFGRSVEQKAILLKSVRDCGRYSDPCPEKYRVRVALLCAINGAVDPSVAWEGQAVLRAGEEATIEGTFSLPIERPWGCESRFDVVIPGGGRKGLRARTDTKVEGSVRCTVALQHRRGMHLAVSNGNVTLPIRGGIGGGGFTVPIGYVGATWYSYESQDDEGNLVEHVLVALGEPEESPGKPWSAGEWRHRIVENIEEFSNNLIKALDNATRNQRISNELGSGHDRVMRILNPGKSLLGRHEHFIRALETVGTILPLTEVRQQMEMLEAELRGSRIRDLDDNFQNNMSSELNEAIVLAGGTRPSSRTRVGYDLRLIAKATDGETRKAAGSRLESAALPTGVARTLREAPPDWPIPERVRRWAAEMAPKMLPGWQSSHAKTLAPYGVVFLVAGLAVGLSFLQSLAARARLVIAVAAGICALIAAGADARLHEWDLRFATIGYGIAALAVMSIAQVLGERWIAWPAAGFLVAAIMSAMVPQDPSTAWTLHVGEAAAGLAMGGVAYLIGALRSDRRVGETGSGRVLVSAILYWMLTLVPNAIAVAFATFRGSNFFSTLSQELLFSEVFAQTLQLVSLAWIIIAAVMLLVRALRWHPKAVVSTLAG